jgi:hypothetical protein
MIAPVYLSALVFGAWPLFGSIMFERTDKGNYNKLQFWRDDHRNQTFQELLASISVVLVSRGRYSLACRIGQKRMIANRTTLILGAGASKPFGYPTGAELRQQIIKRVGMRFQDPVYEELLNRFRWSLVSSIDAFLAESENHHLQDIGRVAIVAALAKAEARDQTPDW